MNPAIPAAVPPPAARAGFTLMEMLAVLAIIAILSAFIVTLNKGNPEGLAGALRISEHVFKTARGTASLAPNPDRDPKTNPLYNIRSRVLILKDTENKYPSEKLRKMRVIVGGTKDPDSTKISDYRWYNLAGTDTTLPKSVYMVEPTESSLEGRVSKLSNKDNLGETMRLDYRLTTDFQSEGSGDAEWYFYEFNGDGTTNMNVAVFMVAEGSWDQSEKKPVFKNKNAVTGFYITPTGNLIAYTDTAEIDANKGN